MVWTRPEGVLSAYADALGGTRVDPSAVEADVDRFADALLGAKERTRWMLVPSWTPSFGARGLGVVDFHDPSGTRALLARANAELNFGITPPPEYSYALKVPAESEERVRSVLGDPQVELLRHQLHTVRSGDTFYGLARHYGAAVELIQSSNPGVDPRRMRIGMLLKIPVVGGAVREPPPAPSTPAPSYDGRYVVRSGDTLWAISRRHGITPELLAAANGRALDELLRPGDTLKVPATEAPGTEASGTEGSGAPGSREGSGT